MTDCEAEKQVLLLSMFRRLCDMILSFEEEAARAGFTTERIAVFNQLRKDLQAMADRLVVTINLGVN